MTSKIIVVIGPTAVGKTARALELAPKVNGEIVSADSRHIYRRMNIGTNKPTAAEQSTAKHHLLDIRDPHEPFSLAEYLELARETVNDIHMRKKTPILVGGTGQYIKAFIEGWQVPEVPPNEQIRARWQAFADEKGAEALNRELIARDVTAGVTIDPRNVRRVIRALEVMEITGQKWSELQRKNPLGSDDFEIVNVALPRDELHKRADARIDQMMHNGWLNEVKNLLAYLEEKGCPPDAALKLPSMSALGYRELSEVLAGRLTQHDAIEQIKLETHRFIRMQDVLFRPLIRKPAQDQTPPAP